MIKIELSNNSPHKIEKVSNFREFINLLIVGYYNTNETDTTYTFVAFRKDTGYMYIVCIPDHRPDNIIVLSEALSGNHVDTITENNFVTAYNDKYDFYIINDQELYKNLKNN